MIDPLIRDLPWLDRRTLPDRELVALLVGSGASLERVLARFPTALALEQAGMAELTSCGLGPSRARRLKAALELGRRTLAAPERAESIRSARDVCGHLRAHFVGLEREELHVFGLDHRSRLILHFVAAVGAANLVYVQPRDVFRPLVRENAQVAIVAHNHPSGDREPSDSDAELTVRLAEAGTLVGIPLVDHVIVAAGTFYSFAESCQLARPAKAA